jgi:hypothetical protein
MQFCSAKLVLLKFELKSVHEKINLFPKLRWNSGEIYFTGLTKRIDVIIHSLELISFQSIIRLALNIKQAIYIIIRRELI